MALLSLRDIRVAFGGPPLLAGASLQIEPGDRICLLGRNGTGKSTLLKVVNGEIAPDEGEIVRQQGVKVALVPQEIPPGLSGSVRDIVSAGPGIAAEKAISRLGLSPGADFGTLSGGMQRRVLIARALARESDILLLDEPTNHLDIDGIAWLENFLLREARTLLFVTHDRMFLRKLATRIVELDRGTTPRLGVRLRHVPRAPGGGSRGRKRAAGAVRQEARRGGNLDPPGRESANHPERGAGTRPGEDARGAARAAGTDGNGPHAGADARSLRQARRRGPGGGGRFRRSSRDPGLLDHDPPGRPGGDHRAERVGQDDPVRVLLGELPPRSEPCGSGHA